MDDKEIKNDLPGPVSHFPAQARADPGSSPSGSNTHMRPPHPPATPAAHLPPAPQTRDDSA